MEVRLTAGGAEEGGREGGRMVDGAAYGFPARAYRCLEAISTNVHEPGRLSKRAEEGTDQIGKTDMCWSATRVRSKGLSYHQKCRARKGQRK